ncbi:MAG: hypothetical protein DWQ09_02425 [Proteobacteria bacterium]|nr:MAG: hypothetical protein DWQ09_02425 [Pseudomonadota bacterium]
MPWTYNYSPTLQIVEVFYVGRTTAYDLKESTSELIALEKEKGVNRFLIDTSEMEFVASMIDILDLPEKQYIEEEADRSGRIALIMPTSLRTKEAVEFYETACKNRGWNVQTFLEREEAVRWLTDDKSSNKTDSGDGS